MKWLLLLSLAGSFAHADEKLGPTEVVKQIFTLAARPEVSTDKAKQDEVNAYVDFDALSRAALGKQAKGLAPAEIIWFRDTLKEIISRTVFPKAPEFLSGVSITYKASVAPSGSTAKVQSSVQNKADLTDVDYQLVSEKEWKVSDVSISGQSWVESIRDQVASVVKKKKWKGLKENMTRRLNELKNGKA